MGASPPRCLVVEDSLPGVQAARAAGMGVLLYAGGGHMAGPLPAAFDMDPPLAAFRSWAAIERAVPGLARPPDRRPAAP